MKIQPQQLLRLQFLTRVVRKECQHLATTDRRLFASPFTHIQANQLETDADLAERVEAFVGRFSRLQDTVGDKLLPLLLDSLGEKPSSVIDNLDRAERLGWLTSADEWMTIRNLRNQMIHEYVEDLAVLVSALQTGHSYVLTIIEAAEKMIAEIEKRGWN
jgi:hypothetical protein